MTTDINQVFIQRGRCTAYGPPSPSLRRFPTSAACEPASQRHTVAQPIATFHDASLHTRRDLCDVCDCACIQVCSCTRVRAYERRCLQPQICARHYFRDPLIEAITSIQKQEIALSRQRWRHGFIARCISRKSFSAGISLEDRRRK